MPVVEIVLQADVSDLPSYYPDDPKGVTISNIAEFLHNRLVVGAMTNKIKDMAREETIRSYDNGDVLYEYLIKHHDADIALAQRLTESMRIELTE